MPLAMPGQDSDQTFVLDLFGVETIISVSGTFTGATTAAVKTQVDAIMALANGAQTGTVAFDTDELGDGHGGAGSIQVMIGGIDVTWDPPSNRAMYVLRLTEGTAT